MGVPLAFRLRIPAYFYFQFPKLISMAFPILARAIRHTLLEEGEVRLPRLGRLELVYQPARLDRQAARIRPPAQTPVFHPDPDLILEPSTLTASWQRFAAESEASAGLSAETELFAMASQIGLGEEVELPDVGLFRPDKRGGLLFIPSDFNYHLDVYGLSDVPARPLQRRSAAQAAAEALAARDVLPRRPADAGMRRPADRWFLPVMSGLLLLAIGISLWLLLRPAAPDLPPLLVAEDQDDAGGPAYRDEENLRESSDIIDLSAIDDQEMEEDEEPAAETPAPVPDPAREVTIVVGHFGDPANAERVLERLTAMGLQGESLPRRELTRVIVRVNEALDDPHSVLEQVRQNFDKGAWIQR
jgi:hypothetical protein